MPVSVVTAPTAQWDAGIDGAAIADDNAAVSGRVQAPANAAVIINGQLAALAPDGAFFANAVPLQPGSNAITLVLNTLDAPPVSRTLTLNRTGVAPFQVSVSPQEGVAPLATDLTIVNRGAVAFQRIEIDTDDDGSPEMTLTSLANQQAQIALTYPTPGVHTVRVTVFDASNRAVYLAKRKVHVVNPAELGLKVVDVYASMVARLAANNPTAALKYFTGGAQTVYDNVFNSLGSALPAVAGQLGTLVDGVVTEETAELTLARDTPSGKQMFMIYLIRGDDGLWHIESM